MTPTIAEVMGRAPVIPVLEIEDRAQAVPLARALVAGGLPVLEVTLRTGAALEAVAAIRREVPEALVGVGTVTRVGHCREAADAGASFLVSPGVTERLLAAAEAAGLGLLPGIATASEIILAGEAGLRHLKFFPAEANGGTAALRALRGPFPDVRFCPTGGVRPQNFLDYLSLPNVLCVGGSWLAPASALAAGDWDRITDLARQVSGERPRALAAGQPWDDDALSSVAGEEDPGAAAEDLRG
ncbi:bifunctional 4-hydroxy-2-oxoglutarate aldolase/2-dehydro-3-deoxy-phosphogluconate aldolase [Sediminicurvatus halobius]|uniref:2-dehydro-3-deoxy-phosphogluconate aldolase n=1 Tax=Sediminicurvatus halobius TaxID=2182432 RepID=A0A2U2N699_9GAMM|nr:bifunctional 4-hydroxy-2-oxoglutarate aldolase/2-dehydro-3-deoxy-phosphogluconate aldolase [Spiribacter halobius]PWG64660.1 keto-deoxy-phosphogluconate aldolase [Spiribacter halobius]UEX79016.1 bifunctional 4-hydroxy-2-oxoglutarate aldolase/2-dehydro-3-deoxy-phosphogluconate aldolase [Spiribacter halobius]